MEGNMKFISKRERVLTTIMGIVIVIIIVIQILHDVNII